MRVGAAWVGTDRLVFLRCSGFEAGGGCQGGGESDDSDDGRPKKKIALLQRAPRARRTGSGEYCFTLSVLVWHYISFRFPYVIIFQIGGPQSGASTIENVDRGEN